MTKTLKEHVNGKVHFQYYRDKQLFYRTDDGFVFPVPINDIDQGTCLADDNALYYMKWIRKWMKEQASWNRKLLRTIENHET